MKQLAIYISDAGTGSNLQAIMQAISDSVLSAHIAVVVSDSTSAPGLKKAATQGIATQVVDKKTNLIPLMQNYCIDYIVLAGWKQIIPDIVINTYQQKILNLHPGLIPDTTDGEVLCPDGTKGLWNRGLFTHKAIQNFINSKATYAGSSVHFLTQEFDFGPVLQRCFVKIKPDDSVETLYSRLKKQEHVIYLKALKQITD